MGLRWDVRTYEAGIDQGVVYPKNGEAEPWNGLISVKETPEELNSRVRYFDGIKVINKKSEESFSATIEAYTYPDGVISRKPFGFSYRVHTEKNYKIHLVYNVLAKMSELTYEQEETTPFRFDISTTPVPVPGAKATAHLIVDISNAYALTVIDLENILYGYESGQARLPLPEEVLSIFEQHAFLRVVDHGDGTFSITGPPEMVQMINDTMFLIDSPGVVYLNQSTYTISSW